MERIAIMADSGCDLPEEMINKENVRVLPLKILYEDGEYLDGVNIEPSMVYDRFPGQIPKTSTPNFAEVIAAAEELKAKGYNRILAVCISSGLSSTWQNVCAALSEVEDIEFHAVDSKNISIGAGVLAMYAQQLVEQGLPFEEICRRVEENVESSHIFYYMDTLDYLRAGGRIGRVSGAIGSLLNIKPIISCNRSGVYHIVSMIRGRKRGLEKLLDCVSEHYDEKKENFLAIMHGAAPEAVRETREKIRARFPRVKVLLEKQINASLAVHTGPGLIGVLCWTKV